MKRRKVLDALPERLQITSVDQERSPLSGDEFREIIGSFVSGVTVITAVHDGKWYGTTASAVSSLSLEPPMLLICMNKESSTGQAIAESKRFAVNILSEGHAKIAKRFARKDADKFSGVATIEGQLGGPLLADALATLECRVVEAPTGGTHWVFLSEVEVASGRPGAPLAYFRGRFGRVQLQEDMTAYEQLRRRVVLREVPAGSKLEIEPLADELGVPASSAYHAVIELVGEGLVSCDAADRFVVRPLTLEMALDACHARFAVLKRVAELTVGKCSDAELVELRRLIEATDPVKHSSDGETDTWIDSLVRLFEYLVSLPGSFALIDAFKRVGAPAMILSGYVARHWVNAPELREATHQSRQALEGAYAAGDLAAAIAALESIGASAVNSASAVFAERAQI